MALEMKIGLSDTYKKYLRVLKPLSKHHYFAYSIALLCGLAVAVFMINETLTVPTDEAYRAEKLSTGVNANFNQQTIKKIEELKRSSEAGDNLSLPTGVRTNPFSE